MPESVLQAVADRLADDGNASEPVGPLGDWTTLVRVVLLMGRTKKQTADWSWLEDTALRSAEETMACPRASLEAELESAGHAPNRAACLPALARWWQSRFGNGDAPTDQWATFRDRWREELRRLKGVNWELADRILLHVGGASVMPLDRGTMRIAVRHGWIDPAAEYDEWQSYFIRGLHDANLNPGQFSLRMARVGAAYCGKVPKCDDCPLRLLLPAGGPIPIDGSESE